MIKSLRFYTFQSFIGHILIVIAFMLATYMFWGDLFKIRKENLKLISASVRVDMVALPDKTLKELKSLQQLQASVPPPIKEEPKTKTEPVKKVEVKTDQSKSQGKDFKTSVKKKSLSDILKKYSKNKIKIKHKKVKTKTKKVDNGLKAKDLERLRGLVNKGNKVRSGVALTGVASEAELSAFEQYAAAMPDLIRPYWKLPSYLLEQGLRCRVKVFINQDGKVLRKMIFESSGEEDFDKKALQAIDKASPFPAPSKLIIKKLSMGEVILGFPL